jgi:NitT/TauT family transport system substrate-binding protein
VKIKLMENFRAIFYAPYYAIHTLGFYKSEGIDVELTTSDAPGDAVAHLINGTIDLTWGGPMRVMMAHDRHPGSSLVSFGEVVSRDPFFLIGNCEPFTLAKVTQFRLRSADTVGVPPA